MRSVSRLPWLVSLWLCACGGPDLIGTYVASPEAVARAFAANPLAKNLDFVRTGAAASPAAEAWHMVLELRADTTFRLGLRMLDTPESVRTGSWVQDGTRVTLAIAAVDGAPVTAAQPLTAEFVDQTLQLQAEPGAARVALLRQ